MIAKSDALLVLEAKKNSATINIAKFAIDNNVNTFVIKPQNPSKFNEGNIIISNYGAKNYIYKTKKLNINNNDKEILSLIKSGISDIYKLKTLTEKSELNIEMSILNLKNQNLITKDTKGNWIYNSWI